MPLNAGTGDLPCGHFGTTRLLGSQELQNLRVTQTRERLRQDRREAVSTSVSHEPEATVILRSHRSLGLRLVVATSRLRSPVDQ
jgi:hypothetical protein